jgi:hypothetical protein
MGFSSQLSQQDRDLLRNIVRKVHLRHVGLKHGEVSNMECDKLIDSFGPEIVERMIKFGVDKGLR